MEGAYRKTKTILSFLQYHIIFCPRYRRKIFLIPKLEERFKVLTEEKCREMEVDILHMECREDYIYLLLDCPPNRGANELVGKIKTYTGKVLRAEFGQLSKMPNLWTRNYFISTEKEISDDAIMEYVEMQKKRY